MPRHTAGDFIELVPGFQIVQHGNEGKGHQFFVRGFDAVHGADVEVRLEGIPLNEPSNIHGNGYLDLAFIIPEAVLALDARKGAFEIGQARLLSSDDLEISGLVAGYAADFGLPGAVRLSDVRGGSMGFYDAYVDDTRPRFCRAPGRRWSRRRLVAGLLAAPRRRRPGRRHRPAGR